MVLWYKNFELPVQKITFEPHENKIRMKSKLFFLVLFLYTTQIIAKEGMWLPFLLQQMNEKEMRQMGMKIKASDIYDVNEGSLKDAVVIFGGGCTGEVISNQGLVLTNHHCGYGAVQGLSSVAHNYLLQGFWAKNNQEELPCPGLSVTFIIRIDDVTAQVKEGIETDMTDSTKNSIIANNIARIEKETKTATGYGAQIKSFYYENEYYLFTTEKFEDIRLVGFPPNGIGKFGGDADNWAWPRHTGDFGVFRIYANKENKPAAYSKENIPFTPRRSFSINIGGVEEGDFTWVYGFPGRTQEYLTSDGVAEIMQTLDPARIKIREKRLQIMENSMKQSESNFIKYASKQAGIANYYKKWKGELLGLQINHAIDEKQTQEAVFNAWCLLNESRKKYADVIDKLKSIYDQQQPVILKNEYINEAIWASEILKKGSLLVQLNKILDTLTSSQPLQAAIKDLNEFHQGIDIATDKEIAMNLFAMYRKDIEPWSIINVENIESLYRESLLVKPEQFTQLLQSGQIAQIKQKIQQDIAYKMYVQIDKVQKENLVRLKSYAMSLNALYGQYIIGLKQYHEGKLFYPDANSTLRVSYGLVEGIQPQDGMTYNYYTTLEGAVRKHNPAVEEFTMPEKLLALHEAQDYGDYSINHQGIKTVPLAFLASNHTTGGNSGSPVLNAQGELIGTNFDRIWEGTMSDIMYDINLCRNITLDIRYTLFIIEKFGGARWLIDEMDIIK